MTNESIIRKRLDNRRPKGQVLEECGYLLKKAGYKVKVLNTIDFSKSMKYNPFSYIKKESDIMKVADALIEGTTCGKQQGEQFWLDAERLLYNALIGYIWSEGTEDERNFGTLLDMVNLISKSQWRMIEKRKCEVRFIKLVREGKNGLDFYIASELANVIAKEPYNENVIISHDKGFNAVCDYWGSKEESHRVIRMDSMADFYSYIEKRKVHVMRLDCKDKLSFDALRREYALSHDTECMLRKIYAGTEYVSAVNEIKKIYEENHDLLAKYRAFLKYFGKKKGTEAYHLLQDGILALYM